MKLLALVEGTDHVCHRYRVAAYAAALAARGWRVEARPLSRRTSARLWQLRQAKAADVVLLQRRLLPIWQLGLLRRWARRLVFDFDDAVFLRDSFAAKGHYSRLRLARFWATAYASDAVLAGNRHLADTTTQLVGEEKVATLPTCVSPERYRLASHAATGAVRLAWIGQPSTLRYLHHASGLLAAALAPLPQARLCVICDRAPKIPGVSVELRPWSTTTETRDLAECDIGISYLPDDPWSEGKCGLKVLQYMAAGLPVVANPVGMNRHMVRHGENGYLARTTEEWTAAIGRLAGNGDLRRQMGLSGRRLIERQFSAANGSEDFADILQCVAEGRPLEVGRRPAQETWPSARELFHAA